MEDIYIYVTRREERCTQGCSEEQLKIREHLDRMGRCKLEHSVKSSLTLIWLNATDFFKLISDMTQFRYHDFRYDRN
jgi:hypothetical protein